MVLAVGRGEEEGGGEDVCGDEWQGVVRREDVRATEKEKVLCAEGFRVGDVVRGVVVSAFFFCLLWDGVGCVGVVARLRDGMVGWWDWGREGRWLMLYRSVLVTSRITTCLRRGMSWVSLWRRARRGIRWFRLAGRSLGIRLLGRGRAGRLRNLFEGSEGSIEERWAVWEKMIAGVLEHS